VFRHARLLSGLHVILGFPHFPELTAQLGEVLSERVSQLIVFLPGDG
jgi:hypothetical protein